MEFIQKMTFEGMYMELDELLISACDKYTLTEKVYYKFNELYLQIFKI